MKLTDSRQQELRQNFHKIVKEYDSKYPRILLNQVLFFNGNPTDIYGQVLAFRNKMGTFQTVSIVRPTDEEFGIGTQSGNTEEDHIKLVEAEGTYIEELKEELGATYWGEQRLTNEYGWLVTDTTDTRYDNDNTGIWLYDPAARTVLEGDVMTREEIDDELFAGIADEAASEMMNDAMTKLIAASK